PETTQKRTPKLLRPQRQTPPGSPPGTVKPVSTLTPVLCTIAYGPDAYEERSFASVNDLQNLKGAYPVLWVNIEGLGDAETITKIGEVFGLHPLALEDVVNVHQRAKVEDYKNNLYIVLREPDQSIEHLTEQVSLFIGSDFVLSFLERPGDCFEPVRARLRKGASRLRQAGPDFLAYSLLDAILDSYFPLLEEYGDRLERIEDDLLGEPTPIGIRKVHEIKRDLISLRRAIWPLRDVFYNLIWEENPFIATETRLYLRDCYDHVGQLRDLEETYRELCSDLSDLYLSATSNRLNEVMTVLTLIATIFIPLSFIAGIYGMNFDPEASPFNMPELSWRYGYFFALGLMMLTGLGMLFYFWQRGWIGGKKKPRSPTAKDRQPKKD
ncbi:MAG: magnesium/cobalt transporter CorA, partial [Candidatus Caldarchaeum sp.]